MAEPFMLIRNHSWEVERKRVSEHKAGREETVHYHSFSLRSVMLPLLQIPGPRPSERSMSNVQESELEKGFLNLADDHNPLECFLKGTAFQAPPVEVLIQQVQTGIQENEC